MSILVAGEALIDFFPANCGKRRGFVPFPGGSPLNVAVGLGRLGVPVGFLGKVSKDPFGRLLRSHLEESGVDLSYLKQGPEPSAFSFVHLKGEGEPGFGFYGACTADTQLTPKMVPASLPTSSQAIHLGSLAMIRQPSGFTLTRLMEREHGKRLISFDPNVRPSQIADRGSYLTKLRHWLSLSDLIRASRSDLEYLYPNMSPEAVAKRWLKLGPSLVVITYGGDGAVGYNARAMIAAKGTPVEVVDPVGAGDAFSAGLIAWLYNHDRLDTVHLPRLSPEELERALTYATRVATITCTRMGANPPYRSELEPDS